MYAKMFTPISCTNAKTLHRKLYILQTEHTQNERRSLCRFRSFPSHSAHVEIAQNEATGRETLQTSICCSELVCVTNQIFIRR